jgi:hypothetical protein
MRKVILQLVKATFPIAAVFSTLINTAFSQQNIIANKDDTHPEVSDRQYIPARILAFSAVPWIGYNEIQWSAAAEQDTRRYIVEYSDDGINYQTAGEVLVTTGSYILKHHTTDNSSFLYRIRIEKKDGRFVNSSSFLLEGKDSPVVLIYPTILENNTINLRMYFPVEKISITAADGRQVFEKHLGGITGTTQIVIPSLSKGMYFLTAHGNGWKTTSKFIIGR